MSQQTAAANVEPTLSDLVDHLTRYEGPPDEFLIHLLAVQCHVGSAESGAIIRGRPDAEPEVLAVFPVPEEGQTAPVWLAQSVESVKRVAQSTHTAIVPLAGTDDLYNQAPRSHLLLVPLRAGEGVRGVAAFVILSGDTALIDQCRQRLELTVSLLSLYEMRLTLQRRQTDLQRLRQSLEVMASVNDNKRFKAAAMALCNEIASVWESDRVTLGFIKGRYVKAVAMSHTEKFTRKMKLVLDIESAMEECFDQDVEVVHPSAPEATFVSRATGELSSKHGPNTVCSVPLRREQQVIGVLTVERSIDKPFNMDEIQTLRLVSELCTARMSDLHDHDKWFGAKAAGVMRKSVALLVGHEHTWLKLLVVGVFAAIVLLSVLRGNDYVQGSFVTEAVQTSHLASPFDGYLIEINVEPGDVVKAGDILARLDTEDLKERQRSVLKDLLRLEREKLRLTLSPTALTQIEPQIDSIKAQLKLIENQLEKAVITAPIDGTITEGDWKRELDRPFSTGDLLFKIAPLEHLRAEVHVPEKRIADIERARKEHGELTGELAAVSHPGDYLPIKVQRVWPMAEIINDRNVFRVRVSLDIDQEKWQQINTWFRPGEEGQARIKVGQAHYIWIWTRDLIHWVRMKLWI